MEIQENLTFGERLSPELEDAMPRLCEKLLGEIEELLTAGGRSHNPQPKPIDHTDDG